MTLNVKISENIIGRLASTINSCHGKLYGISTKNVLIITILQKHFENELCFSNSLPAEIKLCGSFIVTTDCLPPKVPVTPKSVLLTYTIGKDFNFYMEKNGEYVKSEYKVISEQEINTTFLFTRVKGEIPLKSEFSTTALKEAFQVIQKTISSEAVFGLLKSNIFLLENEVIGIDNDISLTEFCGELNSFGDEINRKKNKALNVKPRVLEFNFLQHLSKTKSIEIVREHAPIVILDKHPFTVIDTFLQLDSLSMVNEQTKAYELYDILMEGTKRILRLFEIKILNFVESKNPAKSLAYEIHHYYPEECRHFLTLLYGKDQIEKDLKTQRQNLHDQLMLNGFSPCFRKANKYSFDKKLNGPLINPHEGVKNSDNGGTIALVKGKYEYYHYCQNKMDDSGWGCAYRSLQTLASWFKLQGYVDRDVPTFKEIQQCLVDIKDKPANFVDSRQWIGSTEVNFVLNTLLGVENKILYVSSGDDMSSKGPELLNHFQNHGSPIMIGGGVLAHTILGVDYNQQTGTIKFLILDPHYTGTEDIHIIQSKGWCGWKNVDFWNKTSYYNMCLPLVPREV